MTHLRLTSSKYRFALVSPVRPSVLDACGRQDTLAHTGLIPADDAVGLSHVVRGRDRTTEVDIKAHVVAWTAVSDRVLAGDGAVIRGIVIAVTIGIARAER